MWGKKRRHPQSQDGQINLGIKKLWVFFVRIWQSSMKVKKEDQMLKNAKVLLLELYYGANNLWLSFTIKTNRCYTYSKGEHDGFLAHESLCSYLQVQKIVGKMYESLNINNASGWRYLFFFTSQKICFMKIGTVWGSDSNLASVYMQCGNTLVTIKNLEFSSGFADKYWKLL